MADTHELLFYSMTRAWNDGFHFYQETTGQSETQAAIFTSLRKASFALTKGNHREALLFATRVLGMSNDGPSILKKILPQFNNDSVKPEVVLKKLEELARQDTTGSSLRFLYRVHDYLADHYLVPKHSMSQDPAKGRLSVVYPAASPK